MLAMPCPPPPTHQRLAVPVLRVPAPFRSLAVRSDEPRHAMAARAPYGWVHHLATRFLGAEDLARLVAHGQAQVQLQDFGDIDYARTSLAQLAATAPGVGDWAESLAGALQLTGVLGDHPDAYRQSLLTRIDYLGAQGAGFHNDVNRHWSRCLFWLLALDVADVELVMPQVGLRLPLAVGDLLVFDQTLAHGLCRPHDQGQALAASFEGGPQDRQLFLTGELPLSDAQWAALGSPWLPVEVHDEQAALDLMVAEFDDRSGAVKRPRALLQGMKRSTCHVDEDEAREAPDGSGTSPPG